MTANTLGNLHPQPKPISAMQLQYVEGRLSRSNPGKTVTPLRAALKRLTEMLGPSNREILISNAVKNESALNFAMRLSGTYLKIKWKNSSGSHVAELQFDSGRIQIDGESPSTQSQNQLAAVLFNVSGQINQKSVRMFRPKTGENKGEN